MPNFTELQTVRIKRFLGYANVDVLGDKSDSVQVLNERLAIAQSAAYIAEVQTILDNLIACEQHIATALSKSRILKADVITFDYGRQQSLVQQSGSNYICELANLLGVEIRRNKFAGGSSQISFRSY